MPQTRFELTKQELNNKWGQLSQQDQFTSATLSFSLFEANARKSLLFQGVARFCVYLAHSQRPENAIKMSIIRRDCVHCPSFVRKNYVLNWPARALLVRKSWVDEGIDTNHHQRLNLATVSRLCSGISYIEPDSVPSTIDSDQMWMKNKIASHLWLIISMLEIRSI